MPSTKATSSRSHRSKADSKPLGHPLTKRGNRIAVALADPTNLRALDEIRFQTGLAVDPVVVEANKLAPIVQRLSETAETKLNELAGDELDFGLAEETEETGVAEAGTGEVDDAPVVRFIQKILLDAINEGASDIHFEPYENITGFVSAPMAFCARSPSLPSSSRKRSPHASR